MTRLQAARLLTAVTAVGFLATAALHATGYSSVVRLSADVPAVAELMPALWLAFSSDLVIIGLIVALLAFKPTGLARLVLPVAAACPLVVAGLQVRYLGFVPPTAVLLLLGTLTLASAAAWPPGVDTAAGAEPRDHG